MPYTAHTWVSGEQITAAKLNTIENAVALYSGAVTATTEVSTTTAFSTSSTSYVDVTGMSTSVTTTGGDLVVIASGGGFGTGNSGGAAMLAVSVNGTEYTVGYVKGSGTTPSYAPLAGAVKVTGLAAGTYTVKLRAKVSSATGSSEISVGGSRTSLIALELKR